MNIVVCIKQVPDTTDVCIDPDTGTLIREGVESIINPFDMYAIEEGVRLRERVGGKVTVLSMGPPQVESSLRESISMGIDEAILLSDRAFAGSDTWATSYTLAAGIRKIGNVDLIICGKQASDGDTAQVGPGIAVHLDIPQVTFVKKIEEISDKRIQVERLMDEGYDVVEVSLPAMISVVKEINEPRIPSLKGKMRARTYQLTVWGKDDIEIDESEIGLDGSPTQVMKVFSPPKRSGGVKLLGEPSEMAEKLYVGLKERQLI